MEAGIVATIGKGDRSPAVAEACCQSGGVYLGALGGIAALLARHVDSVKSVAYPELGCEALMRVELDRFPVFVALDSRGGDWYRQAPTRFLTAMGVRS